MQAQPLGMVVPKEHPSLSCPRPCSCLEDSFPAGSCSAQFVPPNIPIPCVTWGVRAGPGGDCLVGTEPCWLCLLACCS